MRSLVRPAAVAGSFYPAEPPALRKQIDWCFSQMAGPVIPEPAISERPVRAPVVIAPHAGYRYSGPVAAHAYGRLWQISHPELVVVVGPNHRLLGAQVAVPGCEYWETPLGLAELDRSSISALTKMLAAIQVDDIAHSVEHSLEVQVPFLQHGDGAPPAILPVLMHSQDSGVCRALGEALAELLRSRNGAIVATSDFTHYEPHEVAQRKDGYALRAIQELDAEGLLTAVAQHRLTMCGVGPVLAAIVASRELGCRSGITLRYATSGDQSGDYSQVVGYAAMSLE